MNSKLYPSHQINKRPFNVYSHYFGKNINFRKYYHYKNRRNKTFTKSINNATQKISESNRYITNLSSKTLTPTQTKLLSKGLSYIPSTNSKNDTLRNALLHFNRSNRIKYFFRNEPERDVHPFRQKSTWMPPRASQDIESYLERLEKEISDITPRHCRNNLSQEETHALKTLASDPSLVIKNADKGSGIVIEDRHNYMEDGLQHLSDKSIYEKSESDPTTPLAEGINKYIHYVHKKGIIDDTTKEFLSFKPHNMPRTQQLYFLKKIHKNPIAVRPIVSGCGGPTEKISQFLDFHLQPHVPKIKSYTRDSGDIINHLEQLKIPPNCILTTIDVKALYLNIPHSEGIKAVLNRLYYKNHNSEDIPVPPSTMSDLLKIVLTKNYFQFADEMYHQIQGTAMGTKMAPAYANIFMAELEEELLDKYHIKPLLWKRYIDDILCIWPGTMSDLKTFMIYLNQAHTTIKFTHESSTTSVDFLDITIYKGKRFELQNILDVKPFFKKTNKFQYLQYKSAHPRQTFSSLIKGELTRLLRACSDKDEYTAVQNKLYKEFRNRGYPAKLIRQVIDSVPHENRTEILGPKDLTNKKYDTFLVLEYAEDLDVKKLRSTLKPLSHEEEHVPKPCLSLKRKRNLGQHLVRAKLKHCSDPPKSNTPITIPVTAELKGQSAGCNNAGCKCCPLMSRKQRIHSSYNNRSFSTPTYANCNTRNVIYLIECTKCTKRNQYVGQTQRCMNIRLGGHRAASKTKPNLPIYKHFLTLPNHNLEKDIKITILEKTTTDQLTTRESHWISTMETVYPKGLNSRFE